jgi:hypothetical protein
LDRALEQLLEVNRRDREMQERLAKAIETLANVIADAMVELHEANRSEVARELFSRCRAVLESVTQAALSDIDGEMQ